jgi:hypothetical protein
MAGFLPPAQTPASLSPSSAEGLLSHPLTYELRSETARRTVGRRPELGLLSQEILMERAQHSERPVTGLHASR